MPFPVQGTPFGYQGLPQMPKPMPLPFNQGAPQMMQVPFQGYPNGMMMQMPAPVPMTLYPYMLPQSPCGLDYPNMSDPEQAKYHTEVIALFSQDEFKTAQKQRKQELVGNLIYDYVERIVGEEYAPKLTGMLIDLPDAELNRAILTLNNLKEKIKIGLDLLIKTAAEEKAQKKQ